MVETKYYTPSIEEFHVGFEYEYRTNGDDWIKHALFTKADLLECIDDLEENDNIIRTKHLDREDIESFGFVDVSRTKGNYDSTDEREDKVFLLKQNYPSLKVSDYHNRFVLRIMKDREIRIQRRGYCKVGEGAYPPHGCWRYCGSSHLFQGTIRNRSELKRILTQIGVI